MKPLSILIADDHELVRRGIRALLEVRPDWTICGEAATGREAIDMATRLHPDLVLLDLSMPELDGLGTVPMLLRASPGTKILVVTMHDSGEMATRLLAAGASGVVLKSDAGRDLVLAVQAIESDQPFLSPAVTKLLLAQMVKTAKGPLPSSISPRELQVLKLLAQGRSNKAVASALDLSIKTVVAHRASIMRKLEFETFSDLIRFAIRHRIIEV
jgi:DNA-binding NarL/FixJ family response regulator